MEVIKFRIYDPIRKKMIESGATPMMLHSFFLATAVLNVRDNMGYQQFTGLLDKSGKEICEGDVVLYQKKYWRVRWSEILARYTLQQGIEDKTFDAFYNDKVSETCEIIGNIYEDELLDKEGKG